MRRLALPVVLLLGLWHAPAAAQAPGKVWRIGFLGDGSPEAGAAHTLEPVREGLRELGYVEGRNLTLDARWSAGSRERRPTWWAPASWPTLWKRCVELKVAPTFHTGVRRQGLCLSPTNFTYNHIGHFAAAGHAVCKALFLGGVTHRFPSLRLFDRRVNPLGARLNALFGSDIGHFYVPDMREVLPAAFELVEDGLITSADFRDFAFANAVRLWGEVNPRFFQGTAVERDAAAVLAEGKATHG